MFSKVKTKKACSLCVFMTFTMKSCAQKWHFDTPMRDFMPSAWQNLLMRGFFLTFVLYPDMEHLYSDVPVFLTMQSKYE